MISIYSTKDGKRDWIVWVPQAGTGSEHYQIRHVDTRYHSILKKFLDLSNLVIGNN